MTDNLELWKSVEKTDPKHVKEITGKSYKGNSPKPHYLIHRATETFGPCGIGWGFEIVDERIEEGAPGDKLHIARVKVWYKWKGERGEVEHVGQTMLSGTRSTGKTYTDDDAPKKSVTDALVKALSMIGFAGDIFMGRFDDNKYVAELQREFDETPTATQTDPHGLPPKDVITNAERMLRGAAPKGRAALRQAYEALNGETRAALKYLVNGDQSELVKIAIKADISRAAA